MPSYMGIDMGSGTSKGVILRNGELAAFHLIPSGVNYRLAADQLKEKLLSVAKLQKEDIAVTVATGQGAGSVFFKDQEAVDIRCCARGINRLFPEARTVIDIQGQSSQVIRLTEKGQVVDFIVSEKCASGSGRFLDIIANVLQVDLKEIGPLAAKSIKPVSFTTGCAVFGESEAVSRVAEGTPVEDILAGVLEALSEKIAALVGRVGLEESCAICGGGALNSGLIERVEKKLGTKLLVPDEPQIVNALGAAVIAEEQEG